MELKIAAITCGGSLSSVESCSEVLVFEKMADMWCVIDRLPFRLEGNSSLEVRDSVRTMILELGDCSVVVAKAMAGIAYHVFDRMGFSVFEADSISDGLFDGLLLDLEQAQKQRKKEQTATEPIPLDDEGRWFLDLISMQEKHPELSSKQALRTFLQKRTFLELKLLCTHFPPWLEAELPARHLGYTVTERAGQCFEVTISRTLCKE